MTESLLICTDLDRTLIPNGPQPESSEARPQCPADPGGREYRDGVELIRP